MNPNDDTTTLELLARLVQTSGVAGIDDPSRGGWRVRAGTAFPDPSSDLRTAIHDAAQRLGIK